MNTKISAPSTHIPVLRDEAIAGLAIKADGVYLDGTFGCGGHAQAVLNRLNEKGRLLVMDKDPEAIHIAREKLGTDVRVLIRQGNFAEMAEWQATAAGLDGILLDLGVSSPQLDQAERGFSFMNDGPLDMRMNPEIGEGAEAWLARASEREIAEVLWKYGEEKASRRIARAIVDWRATKPLARTFELVELIVKTSGRGVPGKHPATRTFQAIRIQVNRELNDLDAGLEASAHVLKPGGRLAVISFHSLEDRRVKQFMRGDSRRVMVRRSLPQPASPPKRWRIVADALLTSAAESVRNPRARSAVLRIAERLP